jgi:uncharacterized membrane protein YdjX (TVP38/TMEM64 family)
MQAGRVRALAALRKAGFGNRVRLLYPKVGEADVMVHSKVMIVDDRLLRIGSSNLCNRSMGTDTECDLAIEAGSEDERRRIRAVSARFLAEHLGAETAVVERMLDARVSLFTMIDRLSKPERGLFPIVDHVELPQEIAEPIEAIADPPEPLILNNGAAYAPHRLRPWFTGAILFAVIVAVALAWRYTGLAAWAQPEQVREVFAGFAASPWAPVFTIGAFIVGGLVFFPLTAMIAGVGMVFGAWPGLLYASVGALASACVGYLVGRIGGGSLLRRLFGPKLSEIRRRIGRQGLMTVAAVRLVPIAPYTVENLAAGAMHLKFTDYIIGTIIGLAPGLLVLTALGRQIAALIARPHWQGIVLTIAALAAWGGISFVVQRLVRQRRR